MTVCVLHLVLHLRFDEPLSHLPVLLLLDFECSLATTFFVQDAIRTTGLVFIPFSHTITCCSFFFYFPVPNLLTFPFPFINHFCCKFLLYSSHLLFSRSSFRNSSFPLLLLSCYFSNLAPLDLSHRVFCITFFLLTNFFFFMIRNP